MVGVVVVVRLVVVVTVVEEIRVVEVIKVVVVVRVVEVIGVVNGQTLKLVVKGPKDNMKKDVGQRMTIPQAAGKKSNPKKLAFWVV